MIVYEHVHFGDHEFGNSRFGYHLFILIDPRQKLMLLHWMYVIAAYKWSTPHGSNHGFGSHIPY